MYILLLKQNRGLVIVIYGPMFSGKSEELIHQLVQAIYMQLKVIAIKPVIDNRYSDDELVSHDGKKIPCITVENAKQILDKITDEVVVGIDKGQFFSDELVEVCKKLAAKGKIVFVAGLLRDYMDKPFGPMPELILNTADFTIAKIARCNKCGSVASCSQRITPEEEQVVVGAKNYEARCRRCYEPPEE
jgi:thymidine kinase